MNTRLKSLFTAYGFFLVLLAWISLATALSFPSEFPNLSLYCKWDCGWYESIARQGYLSPIPPLFQNSEASNVAFFPAYPLLGRTLSGMLRIPLQWALPLVSILSTILVSLAISKLLAHETRRSRLIRYAILIAYPATFYLFVAYSEALYLGAMLGGLALLLSESRKTWGLLLITLAGFFLGGTRLTGFVIPFFFLLGSVLFALRTNAPKDLVKNPEVRRSALFLLASIAAIGAFLLYCYARFDHWNLYFLQLKIGWYKEFSPGKALHLFFNPINPATFDWTILQADSRRLSWMLIDSLVLLSFYIGFRSTRTAVAAFRDGDRPTFLRCFVAIAGIVHLGIVICGDVGPWDAWGNGLRYPMPSVFIFALTWRDEWTPVIFRENPFARRIVLLALLSLLTFLFAHEVGYLGRFIRNEWVS